MVKWTGLFHGVTSRTLNHFYIHCLNGSRADTAHQLLLRPRNSTCFELGGPLSLFSLHLCNSAVPPVAFKNSGYSHSKSTRTLSPPQGSTNLFMNTFSTIRQASPQGELTKEALHGKSKQKHPLCMPY
jgi:hypothetical protein